MISLKQIRAARGLLDLSQADLARHIGISPVTMNNIERGNTAARLQTARAVQEYFEESGVEFIEGDGVRFVDNVFKANFFEGPEGAIMFFRDIIKTLKRLPPEKREVFWYGNNDNAYMQKHRALYFYYRQLIEIGGRETIIVGKDTQSFYAPAATSQYLSLAQRDLSMESDKNKQYLAGLYGENKYFNKVGPKIIVIESKFLYEPLRYQVEHTVSRAKKIHLTERLFDREDKKSRKAKAA